VSENALPTKFVCQPDRKKRTQGLADSRRSLPEKRARREILQDIENVPIATAEDDSVLEKGRVDVIFKKIMKYQIQLHYRHFIKRNYS